MQSPSSRKQQPIKEEHPHFLGLVPEQDRAPNRKNGHQMAGKSGAEKVGCPVLIGRSSGGRTRGRGGALCSEDSEQGWGGILPSTSPLPPTTAYAPELRQGELHAHTTSSTECLTQARPTRHQTPARRTGSAHCRTM